VYGGELMEFFSHGGDIYTNPCVSLDFSVNTNPLGMPKEVVNALISRVGEFERYPDTKNTELISKISQSEHVPEEKILCANGAADLIYRLCAVTAPKTALVCAPTFSEYERALRSVGCKMFYHGLKEEENFDITADIEDKIDRDLDMIFLCNPNNPTGRLINEDILYGILKRTHMYGTRVIIDECFLDFTQGTSAVKYLDEFPKLVILKAFTKIYAMAGLRLGYILTSDADLLSKLSDIAQCWSVSVPAQIAGSAALSCKDIITKTRELIAVERDFLHNGLTKLGIKVYDSHANFLLLKCEKPLYKPLLDRGILIRECGNFRGLSGDYYRIAVKKHEENIRLIEQISEALYG
jgi:threonine-phosphate decarboxylase